MGADIVERLPRWKTGPVLREYPGYFLVPVADIDEAAAEIGRLRGEVERLPAWIIGWMAAREILPDDDGDGIDERALIEALDNHERELLNAIPKPAPAMPNGVEYRANPNGWGAIQRNGVDMSVDEILTALRAADNRDAAGVVACRVDHAVLVQQGRDLEAMERTSAEMDALLDESSAYMMGPSTPAAGVDSLPPGCITINDYIAECEKDPEMKAALDAVRARRPRRNLDSLFAEAERKYPGINARIDARVAELKAEMEITPAAVPAGEAVADDWQHESMRFLAYKLRQMSAVGFDAETCADAASWLEKLSRTPQPADGEAVAWIKPDWQNPANYDGKSPVCTYPQAGWIPLYTTPPAQVQAAPKEGLLSLVSSWRDYAECNERAAGELTSSALTAMRSEGRAIAATKCANELEATLQHRGDSQEVGRG